MSDDRVLVLENDTLPEHCQYRDEGCELAGSCLDCPFPQCIYDTPRGKQALVRERRDGEIARLFREQGRSARELARAFGVSARTVQRVLNRCGPGRKAAVTGRV